jgi:hypothetical protein
MNQFKHFDGELFFVRRLKDHGRHVFDGITDPEERRERIRFAIIEGALESAIIGKSPAGKTETYAQAFERFYGEPLQPQPKGKRRAQLEPA